MAAIIAVFEFSNVFLAAEERKDAVAVPFTVLEFSDVFLATRICSETLPVQLVVLPVADIFISVGSRESTVAVRPRNMRVGRTLGNRPWAIAKFGIAARAVSIAPKPRTPMISWFESCASLAPSLTPPQPTLGQRALAPSPRARGVAAVKGEFCTSNSDWKYDGRTRVLPNHRKQYRFAAKPPPPPSLNPVPTPPRGRAPPRRGFVPSRIWSRQSRIFHILANGRSFCG